MIEHLQQSHGPAFGVKVHGKLTTDDLAELGRQIEATIAANRHPIGLLAYVSEMYGATWPTWSED